jgi:hypothetical protein
VAELLRAGDDPANDDDHAAGVSNALVVQADLAKVVAAYSDFAAGDASPLIDRLDPDVEWRERGVATRVGRDEVAARLKELVESHVEVVGVLERRDALVFEFSRPWWESRFLRRQLVQSLLALQGEQTVSVRDARITRIDARRRFASS